MLTNLRRRLQAIMRYQRDRVLYREINWCQDGYTSYLNHSADIHDLERRMREFHA